MPRNPAFAEPENSIFKARHELSEILVRHGLTHVEAEPAYDPERRALLGFIVEIPNPWGNSVTMTIRLAKDEQGQPYTFVERADFGHKTVPEMGELMSDMCSLGRP
jgi:hypothetical protein